MKLSNYMELIEKLNHAVDSGKYQDISLDEINKNIKEKNIIPYLNDKLGADYVGQYPSEATV